MDYCAVVGANTSGTRALLAREEPTCYLPDRSCPGRRRCALGAVGIAFVGRAKSTTESNASAVGRENRDAYIRVPFALAGRSRCPRHWIELARTGGPSVANVFLSRCCNCNGARVSAASGVSCQPGPTDRQVNRAGLIVASSEGNDELLRHTAPNNCFVIGDRRPRETT
ncbi:unnamed protein product, partial [Iphiclides podalirius]